MPKKVDHDRIGSMIGAGCPVSITASRLGISTRTVRRVMKEQNLKVWQNTMVDTTYESLLWECQRAVGKSPSRIAYLYGFTRQHISGYFKHVEEVASILNTLTPLK